MDFLSQKKLILQTFSHHHVITLLQRVMVSFQIIQIICLFQISKINMEEKQFFRNHRVSSYIFQKMFTLKMNNILISKNKNEDGYFKLLLSDLQLLLDEFDAIMPNKKFQRQVKSQEINNINELDLKGEKFEQEYKKKNESFR
ncbi:unnamed protein product [Paramecium pentaurelia]|uniref:Uncharacterized protein n=1 Tax=Paramecium pentaurelia TaxID=43138 RepID=A0A8S1YPX9_9CILI|nr:unnamed protein product [Paramecium pentaurelia]